MVGFLDEFYKNYSYSIILQSLFFQIYEQGNYWLDWNGTGSYSIAGSANTEDMFPLSEPQL